MPNTTQTEVDDLLEALREQGYSTEDVGSGVGDSAIVNILRDGDYVLTLTLSRTPGY